MPLPALATLLCLAFTPPAPTSLTLEAETAQRSGGVTVVSARPAFSGTGYVTHFQEDGDALEWKIPNAKAGIYEVTLRYAAPSGEKGFVLVVNGAKSEGRFARTGDAWGTASAGKVQLRAGSNTLRLEKGWGYFDIDSITLAPAPPPTVLRPPAPQPVDAQATSGTRVLLRKLIAGYGKTTLSGQYDIPESDYVRDVTGITPDILGGDLIDYSPSRVPFGANANNLSEKLIARAKAGQILTVSWHWNAPTGLLNKKYKNAQGKEIDASWYRGFYTDATTFDFEAALRNPDSPEYKLLLRDIDAIAVQLKKFDEAGVPILWRPLHESEGGWFWWGSKGPKPFVQLWHLLYDRLTNYHELHNLLWVYTGSGSDWYPGDQYVDIVGVDAYPPDSSDALSSMWDAYVKRFNGKKLIALTEFGQVPELTKMRQFGVRWSYFVSWTGDLGPKKLAPAELKRRYQAAGQKP